MTHRLDALFYTFLVIFAATAAVTLLGVIQVVPVSEANLTLLLGAFLIELGAAVIWLFRNAPFFDQKTDVAFSVAHSVGVIDQLSPQIEAVALGQTQAAVNRHHGIVVRREGKDLVAYERRQVISGEDLKRLPQELRDTVETYEKSMTQFRDRWKALYVKRAGASDAQRAEIDQQLKSLVKEMQKDLTGVLDFLTRQGFQLDDHYLGIRHTVESLASQA